MICGRSTRVHSVEEQAQIVKAARENLREALNMLVAEWGLQHTEKALATSHLNFYVLDSWVKAAANDYCEGTAKEETLKLKRKFDAALRSTLNGVDWGLRKAQCYDEDVDREMKVISTFVRLRIRNAANKFVPA